MAGTTLGTAYVQIVPSAKGISGSISNVLGGEAESAGTSIGGKIGAFAKKALTAAAIGTVVVKGLKASFSEGAKLQQSYLGGLDTLYGEAADKAREYARAASEAGISMNTYSEQAVSFGAALKNAYGGDTTKAIEAANRAIMDMADNSAKMGTDIESVQMAYQGFAKQNYTMLDNLKLGYGGTKSEMERLLADAEKLTGIHYDIDNLGDVYDAIHVIQGDLGLTGVAAEEASETFSGSFNAMKAAAQNFMGSLALGDGVSDSLKKLMKATSNFIFKNLIPMLGKIIKSLPKAIATFLKDGLPMLVKDLTTLLKNLTTSIAKTANNLTGPRVAEWAKTTIPKIIVAGAKLIGTLATSFITNLPKIVAAIGRIASAIVTGLGSVLWNKVKNAFKVAWDAIKSLASSTWNSIKATASSAWANIKNAILSPINSAKTTLSNAWTSIKTAASNTWTSIKTTAASLWENIKTTISNKVSAIKTAVNFSGLVSKVKQSVSGVKDALSAPFIKAKELVQSAVKKIKSIFPIKLGKIFSGVKLPHFKISGGKVPWGIGGAGVKPTVSISWYKEGGIMTKPTFFGGGEAGAEAILPLTPFWDRMDRMAESMQQGSGDITINVYATPTMDVNQLAQKVEQRLVAVQQQRNMAYGR